MKQLKPVVKWAGGKRQLINEISLRFPKDLGGKINKYAEPFVGGGAILFHILNNYNMDKIYISDNNKELINLYISLKENGNKLINLLENIETLYLKLDTDNKKKFYNEKRDEFNSFIENNEIFNNINAAAVFIFLNKTCFNGLYRVNKNGLFNVPIGNYNNPLICDKNNLINVSNAFSNIEIVWGDYSLSEQFIDENTFAYFDPPYRPLNPTACFTSYCKEDFDDDHQSRLAEYIIKLKNKGAYILASNSDPKNINPLDNFFDDLYHGFNIDRIDANRIINSKGQERNQIKELLIYNYNISN